MELCQQDAPWNDEVKEAVVQKKKKMQLGECVYLVGVFTENEDNEKY